MMCSLLLKHQDKHSWLYNRIEAFLEALTSGYRRSLAATLSARWLIVVVWLAVAASGALFFTLLKSELAPIEDRGVVFGLVTAPQGSTPVYTSDQIQPIEAFYAQIPEAAAYTAISGFPTVVDGNAVLRLKPWEERKKKQQQITDELRPKMASIPGAIAFPINPPSLGQSFRSTPDRIHRDGAGALRRAAAHRRPLRGGGAQVSRRPEPADRPAAQHAGSAGQHQSRQALRHRRRGRYRRPHAGDDAGRAPGHALQARRRAVRRDRAGRAARPLDARGHQRCLCSRPRRRHGPALQPGRRARRRGAAVAQPLQPAAGGQGDRHAGARLRDRRGAGGDERSCRAVAAEHIPDRPRRPVARIPQLRRRDLLHVRAGAALHLPRAVGAVRELRQSRS